MSKVIFTEDGFADYLYWQMQDRKALRKKNRLIKSIERDGALNGEGKPELLKYKNGEYSRRIDDANRLVYVIYDDNIEIRSCRGHYDDK